MTRITPARCSGKSGPGCDNEEGVTLAGVGCSLELRVNMAKSPPRGHHNLSYDVEAVISLHALADDCHVAVILQTHEAGII